MKAHLEGKLSDAGVVPEAAGEYVDMLLEQTILSVESVRSAVKANTEAEVVSAPSVAGRCCLPFCKLFCNSGLVASPNEARLCNCIAQAQAAEIEAGLDGMKSGHSRLFFMPCADSGLPATDDPAQRQAGAATLHTCDAAEFEEYFCKQLEGLDPQTVRQCILNLPPSLESGSRVTLLQS